MKIVIISSVARSLINFRGPLLAKMSSRGHEVLAFAPDFDAETRIQLMSMGIIPINFSMSRSGINPLKEIIVIFELCKLLLKHRPDVSFQYFLKPVIYGSIASWVARVPRRFGVIEGLGFAFTETEQLDVRRRTVRIIVSILLKFSLSLLNSVIFLNPDDQKDFVNRKLVVRSKTSMMGAIGVNLSDWPNLPSPKTSICFIMIARLLWDKGIREYVEAARILKADYPAARFVLLGGLDENPAAISFNEINAWVDEGIIEWLGHVPVRPWLAKASVFVLPSYREGVPRSTQEAMASGRPVISTDVPGCRETVIHERNGFLVPPRDSVALATAMLHFIKYPKDIEKMGLESRLIAEERFDVHVQNARILELMKL